MVISNCKDFAGRKEYLEELMKYINIDSYGTCLHNKVSPLQYIVASLTIFRMLLTIFLHFIQDSIISSRKLYPNTILE
jgi:hypothetical protein